MPRPFRTLLPLAAVLLFAGPAAARQATPDSPAVAPAVPAAPVSPTLPAGLAAIAHEGEKPAAKELFARHVEAIGGAEAWKDKTSMSSTGSMELPAMGMKGSMRMAVKMPDRFLVTMDLPGIGATRSGCDGTVGWSIDPMRGPSLLDATSLADVRRDANFLRDLELLADPGESETLALVEFDGRPSWAIRLDPRHGGGILLFDRENGLMSGAMRTMATPMGEIPATVSIGEYREFGPVKLATRTTVKVMGQQQVVRVDSVTWDEIDEATFALPDEIKALAKPAADPAKPAAPDATP